MFAGHFGLAAAVKAKTKQVPLWALMLSTQLLDVIFVPLFLSGVETMEPVAPGYGGSIIHADYTHSLVGALFIAMVAGHFAKYLWGLRGGLIISAMVFSHWILDLLVHRPDLPILPGNYGNLPLLGFGLWQFSIVSIVIEFILIAVGLTMYARSILPGTVGVQRKWAVLSTLVLGILLGLSLLTDVLGIA
ncbi:permease [Brevibacillus ginsengisoli]|uniref:permease n=1 Tax=Brevibacillus ginsengisoli TaxID=363854 RepID=UPI003CF12790